MNNMALNEKEVLATIIEDTIAKTYTIFLDGPGGPIITENTLEKAKEEFAEAFKLAQAINNLEFFYLTVTAEDKDKGETAKNISTHKPEIRYTSRIKAIAC